MIFVKGYVIHSFCKLVDYIGMKRIFFLAVFLSLLNLAFAGDDGFIAYNEDFEKGAELFQLNKPEEAIPYFEKIIDGDNVNPDAYIFLSVA